eukprot:scpid90515/ scgid13478/ 
MAMRRPLGLLLLALCGLVLTLHRADAEREQNYNELDDEEIEADRTDSERLEALRSEILRDVIRDEVMDEASQVRQGDDRQQDWVREKERGDKDAEDADDDGDEADDDDGEMDDAMYRAVISALSDRNEGKIGNERFVRTVEKGSPAPTEPPATRQYTPSSRRRRRRRRRRSHGSW